jgi:hypothetical protein
MWETILLAYGILFALVLIATAVSKRNRPTWKGAIISFVIGLLPFYLLFCLLGVMGEKSTNI